MPNVRDRRCNLKWRKRYGGMEKSEVRRLRELEKENAELKKALSEHVIMLNASKEVLKKRGWD
jgi:putative transposase